MPLDEAGTSTIELCTAVQKVSQSVLALSELFESRFGDLVTAGRASEYPPLVDEFKALFAAASSNLERIHAALDKRGLSMVAGLVRTVQRKEERRLAIELERQVLRQRLSRAEEEEQVAIRERLRETQKEQDGCVEEVREALEEIRAEAADLEE
tara:strand:- start:59 stop:520 length:462 start_codon:yes stop_codon:yes gene_type:complete